MFRSLFVAVCLAGTIVACGHDPTPLISTAEPGVVFTFPIDGQLDVPLGARIVVTYSDASLVDAASAQLVGPNGPVAASATVTPAGTGFQWDGPPLDEGTPYSITIGGQTLLGFTTRSSRPRAATPTLIAIDGSPPASYAEHPFRPTLDTSTIRLVFSEPLDPRTVAYEPGSVELIDAAGALVPAVLVASGIHVSIDPVADLTGGAAYTVRLGNKITDLDGHALGSTSIAVTPHATGTGSIQETLRTRQPGDPGPKVPRSGAESNVIAMKKPLIGEEHSTLGPSALVAELGDPKAAPDLGDPLTFVIRRGARLSASGLDVKLDGKIPSGLSTGDIEIEVLTDAAGRMYRNPYRDPSQKPENERAPLYVDLVLDLAIFAKDPKGNAVLAQTVLGVQATGTAIATAGVLAIETVATMELGLLGIAAAPTNFVMELVTDPAADVPVDTTGPTLLASYPAAEVDTQPVGAGIELIFDEPIDLARAKTGIRLLDEDNKTIDTLIESHGAVATIRPRAKLLYGTGYHVVLADVADVAGNPLASASDFTFFTEPLFATDVPLGVTAVYPGAPCTLEGGKCAGRDVNNGDDVYKSFRLPANEPIVVGFTQPIRASTIKLGGQCGAGSVRVESTTDAGGACTATVPGTLIVEDRTIRFIPDAPWTPDAHYRLTLVSGGNESCDANEICGISNEAASFDPLNGDEGGSAGGGNIAIDFTGAPVNGSTFLLTSTTPFSDINGSGFREDEEPARDDNRAALRITGHHGDVSDASFNGDDCIPATPEKETCMYLDGAMPVEMGELATSGCPAGASACIPVTVSPQAMYATSVQMHATAVIGITTDTGVTIMRVREPTDTPLVGYIIDSGDGTPKMVVSLSLYMDAPDMAITLTDHDLHSKPLTMDLEGPVTFLADGRIAIALTNTADVPVAVNIDAPLGISGGIDMIVPAHEMKLSLVSPPIRGVER